MLRFGRVGVEYGEGKTMCSKLGGGKGVWCFQTAVRRPKCCKHRVHCRAWLGPRPGILVRFIPHRALAARERM